MSTDARVGQISDAKRARDFLLAGRAVLTLVSQKTGNRYTYKVTKKPDQRRRDLYVWFVKLRQRETGQEDGDYRYIGLIRQGDASLTWARDAHDVNELATRGFAWFVYHVMAKRPKMPPACEVWHAGHCGRCGRELTDPQSIETGYGPECRKRFEAAA
jgi:Family of unknown function (DUF6011)